MRIFRRSRIALSKAVKSSWLLCVFPAGIIFLSAGMVRAQLIDVHFNNDSYGESHGGPITGPDMSGAAVLGAAGDQWNNIGVTNGTGISFIYANGSNSPATITFTSGGGYDVYAFGGSTPFAGTPYDALMEDYLFNGGTPRTITLSGLAANSIYNLVLYNAADVPAAGRTTYFTVNSSTQTSTWNGSSSNLIAGIDYVEFPSALSDASGNMVITWTGNGSLEGDVNGFQIQFVQGPPTIVTNTADNGPGSLRQLINEAAKGETITFAPGLAGTIALTSGPIMIGNSVNIIGPGPKVMFLTSSNVGTSLELTGGNFFLSGLTITQAGGYDYSGVPAVENSANLTVSNCEFVANGGPGIQDNNHLVILNSSFWDNDGGGLTIGSSATASLTNCTFFYNDSIYSGGAISNRGQLILISCTLWGNDATEESDTGGGVYSTGTAIVGNCAIAGNYANAGEQDVAGNYVSLGFNFIGVTNGSTGFTNGVNSDQAGTSATPINPDFSYPFGYYGGQTMNSLPAIGSPLIDRGNSFGATTDQRGFARTLDFPQIANASGGDGTDIGAVEYGSSIPCSDCVTQVTVDASQTLRPADGRWFGANTAVWEDTFDSADSMSLLDEMGITTLRYPGGSFADEYHWESNYIVGSSYEGWPTAFTNFVQIATNLADVNVFITVNYGTGTTNEAADWVRSANITNQCGFKYWEVGNENYFDNEVDQNTNPPYQAHDPWTYAMRFCSYYTAMKAVDPTIKIGATVTPGEDYYSGGSSSVVNPRTGLTHSGWTPVLLNTLRTNGITPDFLIHHFYPEYEVESDPELLQVTGNWEFDATELRQEISDYFGPGGTNIELLCTENNSESQNQGKQSTSLVNGVYLADSLGQLMQTEFSSYLWWIFEEGADTSGNFSSSLYGWRTYGDYGLALNINTRYPTFYAMKLMHDFVQPGDTILDTGPGYPFLDVFAATKTNGTLSVLFINKDRTNTYSRQITLNNCSPNAAVTVRSYGMTQDNAAETNAPLAMQDIATNQMTVAGGGFTYAFPPYSMTLFTLVPTGPVLTASATASNTVKISWPWPSTGWNLEQNADLTTTNWTMPPEMIQNDGTNNFITITLPAGTIFFRLEHP
jgi:alpha-L-arabinofuranosidase